MLYGNYCHVHNVRNFLFHHQPVSSRPNLPHETPMYCYVPIHVHVPSEFSSLHVRPKSHTLSYPLHTVCLSGHRNDNIDGRHSNSLMPLLPAPVSYIGQTAAGGSTGEPNRLHARPNAVQQLQYRCNYYNSTRHALTPCYCLPAIEYIPRANI